MAIGDYFVMLNAPGGGYTPLMDDDDIAKFFSMAEASVVAVENPLGKMFGFHIFDITEPVTTPPSQGSTDAE